ncbi:MAG TPA: rhomboid family intramembrane serine protease [Myxococcota bacterium]|nr:rhomboid family intramembrane serine protease [Myxococcota bacterium]HRY92071.1 rhomboid family intramembrane serine protease [Myxococcota bacterium]HSA22326.1 rhomboid family intramembrane serine protease [Myxococcota bacterium]
MPGEPYQPAFNRFGLSMRLTRAVKWLLLANAIVFVLELVVGRLDGGLDLILDELAISFDGVFGRARLWQPLTYMFLHDPMGISHILWNMLMLWMFGSPLEGFWGARRFLRFYLLTGLLAAGAILLVAAVFPGQRLAPTLGASGALYALLVAFGFNFPDVVIYLFGLFPIKGKHLVLLFIGLGVLQALTLGASNVSLAAHFGGMLAGLILVTGLWRPSRVASYARLGWMKLRYRRLKRRLKVVDRQDDEPPPGGWRH